MSTEHTRRAITTELPEDGARAYRVELEGANLDPWDTAYTVIGLAEAREMARYEITHADGMPPHGAGPAAVDSTITESGGTLPLAGGATLTITPTDILPENLATDPHGALLELTGDLARDVGAAVHEDHPCHDDETCDIRNALEAGAPFSAAHLLSGATETPNLDAVLAAYRACGRLEFDPRRNVPAEDDRVWTDYFETHARMCDDCGGCTFAADHWEPDACEHCRSSFAAQRVRAALDGAPWHATLHVELVEDHDDWSGDGYTGRLVGRSRDGDTFTLDTSAGERTFALADMGAAERLDDGERTEPLDI